MQVPNGTGPGVRMSNRPLLASRTRCNVLWKPPIFGNIYNGNIFPSLNPAKIFQFISRWTESTKSSAVGPNHRAVINTSNEVKSPLLWDFWIYSFSLRILERVLRWKHCKYKEWVSFFLGSWGMNRSAEQTNRPRTASRFTRFVCPVLRFIPHEPRKKDTHSLNKVKGNKVQFGYEQIGVMSDELRVSLYMVMSQNVM